jgi:hypothetical protein
LYERRGVELKERKDELDQYQRASKKRERPEGLFEKAEGIKL